MCFAYRYIKERQRIGEDITVTKFWKLKSKWASGDELGGLKKGEPQVRQGEFGSSLRYTSRTPLRPRHWWPHALPQVAVKWGLRTGRWVKYL